MEQRLCLLHTGYATGRAYDGEMDVWSVVEGQKAQCGFVQSSGCSECGGCGEAGQIEVVWTFGE